MKDRPILYALVRGQGRAPDMASGTVGRVVFQGTATFIPVGGTFQGGLGHPHPTVDHSLTQGRKHHEDGGKGP